MEEILEHKVVTDYINKDSLIVDCGACLGGFSLPLHSKYKCRFILYEPDIRNYRKLKMICKGLPIIVHNKAIDVSEGTGTFYLGNYVTASSLYSTHRGLGNLHIEVKLTTLDIELKEEPIIDILKIDIEGKEKDVIPNISKDLLKKTKQILVEYHLQSEIEGYTEEDVNRCRDYLKNNGFDEISYFQSKPNAGYDGCYINKELKWT